MSNQNVWLVVGDSIVCRIYEYKRNHIEMVKEIEQPENKLRDIDLTADKPGRYRAKGSGNSAYTQATNPKEVQIKNFAHEISEFLIKMYHNNAFQNLIVAASPHMLGLLLKESDKKIKRRVLHTIEKNLVNLPENALCQYVKKETWG